MKIEIWNWLPDALTISGSIQSNCSRNVSLSLLSRRWNLSVRMVSKSEIFISGSTTQNVKVSVSVGLTVEDPWLYLKSRIDQTVLWRETTMNTNRRFTNVSHSIYNVFCQGSMDCSQGPYVCGLFPVYLFEDPGPLMKHNFIWSDILGIVISSFNISYRDPLLTYSDNLNWIIEGKHGDLSTIKLKILPEGVIEPSDIAY